LTGVFCARNKKPAEKCFAGFWGSLKYRNCCLVVIGSLEYINYLIDIFKKDILKNNWLLLKLLCITLSTQNLYSSIQIPAEIIPAPRSALTVSNKLT